jgi:hypothetical protein
VMDAIIGRVSEWWVAAVNRLKGVGA